MKTYEFSGQEVLLMARVDEPKSEDGGTVAQERADFRQHHEDTDCRGVPGDQVTATNCVIKKPVAEDDVDVKESVDEEAVKQLVELGMTLGKDMGVTCDPSELDKYNHQFACEATTNMRGKITLRPLDERTRKAFGEFRDTLSKGYLCQNWWDGRKHPMPENDTCATVIAKAVLLAFVHDFQVELQTMVGGTRDALLTRCPAYILPQLLLLRRLRRILGEMKADGLTRLPEIRCRLESCHMLAVKNNGFPVDEVRRNGMDMLKSFQAYIEAVHPDLVDYFHYSMDLGRNYFCKDSWLCEMITRAQNKILGIKEDDGAQSWRPPPETLELLAKLMSERGHKHCDDPGRCSCSLWSLIPGAETDPTEGAPSDDRAWTRCEITTGALNYAAMHNIIGHDIIPLCKRGVEYGATSEQVLDHKKDLLSPPQWTPNMVITFGGSPEREFNKMRMAILDNLEPKDDERICRPLMHRFILETIGKRPVYYRTPKDVLATEYVSTGKVSGKAKDPEKKDFLHIVEDMMMQELRGLLFALGNASVPTDWLEIYMEALYAIIPRLEDADVKAGLTPFQCAFVDVVKKKVPKKLRAQVLKSFEAGGEAWEKAKKTLVTYRQDKYSKNKKTKLDTYKLGGKILGDKSLVAIITTKYADLLTGVLEADSGEQKASAPKASAADKEQ